ncbi:hypothetical protein [Microbispora triticiradicis]|nr:hypothetical protein [Microbispora triticiradicis]
MTPGLVAALVLAGLLGPVELLARLAARRRRRTTNDNERREQP